MRCAFLSWIVFLVCLLFHAQSIHRIKVDDRFKKYLSQLVKEFKENPIHPRFDCVILPPRVTGEFHVSKSIYLVPSNTLRA